MTTEQLCEKLAKYKITPYVYQVIKLYADGHGDKQVAQITGKPLPTVSMVKSRLKRRMGCNTSNEMFVKLCKEGII